MHKPKRPYRCFYHGLSVLCFLSLAAGAETGKWQEVDWKGPGGTRIRGVYHPGKTRQQAHKSGSAKKFYRKMLPPQAAARLEGASTTGTPLQALVIESPPIDGFVPWLAVTATNRKSAELELNAIPYTYVTGSYLTADPQNNYAIGLLDTGAGVSVLGNAAATTLGLFSGVPDYVTGSTVAITGVTGSVDAWVSMPFGLFIDGLGAIDPVSGLLSTTGMVGEGNLSVAVGRPPAGGAPDLPTAIGAPMAVYFASVIHNDQRLTVTRNNQTYTGPNVEFFDVDDPSIPEYPIMVPLELRPLGGAAVQYIPCLELFGGCPDGFGAPQTPSVIIGVSSQSLFFVSSVDLYDGAYSAIDKTRFMLDTGAQVSVVGKRIAARLRLDLNHPDFLVEIQGVNGEISIEKGYYLDSVEIPALGEWLSFTNVPVVLLDVASPEGGTLDGIIGTNLFIDYQIVLRGGGLVGMADPSLEVQFMPPGPIDVDYDDDGDVDQDDFAFFQRCYTGRDIAQTDSACAGALLDRDNDVDEYDRQRFEECATAPGIAAASECR